MLKTSERLRGDVISSAFRNSVHSDRGQGGSQHCCCGSRWSLRPRLLAQGQPAAWQSHEQQRMGEISAFLTYQMQPFRSHLKALNIATQALCHPVQAKPPESSRFGHLEPSPVVKRGFLVSGMEICIFQQMGTQCYISVVKLNSKAVKNGEKKKKTKKNEPSMVLESPQLCICLSQFADCTPPGPDKDDL